MSMFLRTTISAAALALAAVAGASSADAQSAPANRQGCTSPPGLNYMICNGQRVPKASNRVVNPDGSWREEVRSGNCVTIKEKTAQGEYKESRRCD